MTPDEIIGTSEDLSPDELRSLQDGMPDEDMLIELAELYKIFGDHTRIRILCALSEKELCVNQIAELLSMTQSAISHQLRILKSARLIRFRRQGKALIYSLADDHVRTLIRCALDHITE